MKYFLSFKHLAVVCGSIMGTLISSISSSSYGAGLCRTALLTPPTETQVLTSFQSLARLKITLDLAQSQGDQTALIASIRQDFKIKKTELQNALGISAIQFENQLREHVLSAQKANSKDLKDKDQETQSRQKTMEALLPKYKLKFKIPIPTMYTSILSSNGRYLFLIDSYNKKNQFVRLNNGVSEYFSWQPQIILKNHILFIQNEQWHSFDLNTLAIKPLSTILTLDRTRSFVVSQNKEIIADFSDLLQIKDGRFIFHLLNKDGSLMHRGDIPLRGPVKKVSYLSSEYMLIHTAEKMLKYTLKNQQVELVDLAPHHHIFPIKGTNRVIAHFQKQTSLYDLDTNQVQERTFMNMASPVHANKDQILIREEVTDFSYNYHEIHPSDFMTSTEIYTNSPELLVKEIPHTNWLAVNNKWSNWTDKGGIVHSKDLENKLFSFQNLYNPEKQKIYDLLVSPDGKRIIAQMTNRSTDPTIEIWDQK